MVYKKMIKDKTITEVKTFNLTCWYIDDVLSINNSPHHIAEIEMRQGKLCLFFVSQVPMVCKWNPV
jgi:hypothetical protein